MTVDQTDAGSDVVQKIFDDSNEGQKWERIPVNGNSDYFTLKNKKSGRYLAALNADVLTIEGITTYFFMIFCVGTLKAFLFIC